MKVFAQAFFKRLGSAAERGGRPPQRAKFLIVRKRHGGGMPIRRVGRGNSTSGGVPLSLHKVTFNRSPLFFWQKTFGV